MVPAPTRPRRLQKTDRPVLVPGQVITGNALAFMAGLDTREVHGFDPGLGYRVFTAGAQEPDIH